MRGTKRAALFDSAPIFNSNDSSSKRVITGSPFEAKPSNPQLPLDMKRAESSKQHLRALNTQLQGWEGSPECFIIPGHQNKQAKNSVVAIFHTSADGDKDDAVVARTFFMRTNTEEDRDKLAAVIHEYAPAG